MRSSHDSLEVFGRKLAVEYVHRDHVLEEAEGRSFKHSYVLQPPLLWSEVLVDSVYQVTCVLIEDDLVFYLL